MAKYVPSSHISFLNAQHCPCEMTSKDFPDSLSIMSLGLETFNELLSPMGFTHDLDDKWIQVLGHGDKF